MKQLSRNGLMHLMVVYVVWSSTYLAIRIAVMPGAGFPPYFMGATRMLASGILLAAIALGKSHSLKITLQDAVKLFITGNLLWVGGNGLVMWAEQYADSGFSALLVTGSPIWTALFSALWLRRLPSLKFTLYTLFGFSGIAVLSFPAISQSLSSTGSADSLMLLANMALVFGSALWSFGSVFQNNRPIKLPVAVISAYQHLFATIGFFTIATLAGEPTPSPSTNAIFAWLYLVIFGSVFAFTSYIKALTLLPINITMTYAYVNPVLALFLGWLVLNETLTVYTFVGAAMVIGSVIGIFSEKQK